MSLVFGRGCIGCLQHERCDKGGILCFIVFIFCFSSRWSVAWFWSGRWVLGGAMVCSQYVCLLVLVVLFFESVAFLYGVCFLFFSFKHNGLSLRMRNESNKCKRKNVKKYYILRISIRLWFLAF